MPHIHLHDYGAGKNSASHGKGSGDTRDYEPGKNPASHAAVTVHKASEKFHRELSNVANGEGDYTSGYKHHKAAEAHNTAAVYHARSHPQANAMSSRANKASKAAASPAEQPRHSAAPGGEAGNAVRPPSRSASAGGTRTQRLFGRR
jgi:hypothetical protein